MAILNPSIVRAALTVFLVACLAGCGGDDDQRAAAAPSASEAASPPAATATATAPAQQSPAATPPAAGTAEPTGTPRARSTSTPSPSPAPTQTRPVAPPPPLAKEAVVLSCLKRAKLDNPERRSLNLWAGVYPETGMDVVVNGPLKKPADAADYAKQLRDVTLAEPAGRYVVSAALTSEADAKVASVARCVEART